MKPYQRIEQTLNYNLYNQIPNKWKTSQLYYTFKEHGLKLGAEAFCSRISNFFENRTRANEKELFSENFSIRLNTDLRLECALRYGDIEIHQKKVRGVAQELKNYMNTLWPNVESLISTSFIFEGLMKLYQIPYYDKTSHFDFGRFKRVLLKETEKKLSESQFLNLVRNLDSIDPDLMEEIKNDGKPIPTLGSGSLRSDDLESVPDFHSLTQAELDWLEGVSKASNIIGYSPFPRIRGTAIKNDYEYPESVRALLKTTKEYARRLSKKSPFSPDLNIRIRKAIGKKAETILYSYINL